MASTSGRYSSQRQYQKRINGTSNSRRYRYLGLVCGGGASTLAAGLAFAQQPDEKKNQSEQIVEITLTEKLGEKLFTFGAIADVQYADIDDKYNFDRTQLRQYRGALNVLSRAMDEWCSSDGRVSFIVNLGDTIDQHNDGLGQSEDACTKVLQEFSRLPVPLLTAVGNHELYNFTRDEITSIFGPAYYSFEPSETKAWKILVLDSYDINCIDTKEKDETKEEAFEYLAKHNPNDVRSYGVNWSTGLEGFGRRFMPYNGALSNKQLEWMKTELEEAEKEGKLVVVCAHLPVAPGCVSSSALTWNYDEVLEILDRHENIIAYFSGHSHEGGYTMRKGVHHVGVPSPLNVTPEDGGVCHATISAHENGLMLRGKGSVSRLLGNEEVQLVKGTPIKTFGSQSKL